MGYNQTSYILYTFPHDPSGPTDDSLCYIMWCCQNPYNLYTLQLLQRGLQSRLCINRGSRARGCSASTACHAPLGLTDYYPECSDAWAECPCCALCLHGLWGFTNLFQWLQSSLHSLWTQQELQPVQSRNQDHISAGESVPPVRRRRRGWRCWRWRTMAAATSAGASPPPPRWYHIWHHIIQWYHNYVISHNGDIRQNYMTSCMMSCVIWFYPFFGSCDIMEMCMISYMMSWKNPHITWPKEWVNTYHIWYHIWYHMWYHTRNCNII